MAHSSPEKSNSSKSLPYRAQSRRETLPNAIEEGDSPDQTTLQGAGSLRQAWHDFSGLTGKAPSQANQREEVVFATDLNFFYCRFDTRDFSAAREGLRNELQHGIKEGAISVSHLHRGLGEAGPEEAQSVQISLKGGW